MKKSVTGLVALMVAGFWLPVNAQQQSLAEAARRVRQQKKEAPQAKRVFTNDDLPGPGSSGVSTVGAAPSSETPSDNTAAASTAGQTAGGTAADTAGGAQPAEKPKNPAEDEAAWRKKFTDLRAKLAAAEKEANIMQRELNLKRQQYYSDPNLAMREQYRYPAGTGGEINDLTKQVADKKQEIEALKRQLSELEDDLRRAGAPASWARE
jgi:cell division septation protein DedD